MPGAPFLVQQLAPRAGDHDPHSLTRTASYFAAIRSGFPPFGLKSTARRMGYPQSITLSIVKTTRTEECGVPGGAALRDSPLILIRLLFLFPAARGFFAIKQWVANVAVDALRMRWYERD
jgi:hypothetical protein